MSPHHLTNSEIQIFYQSKPIFNNVYSRRYLLTIKVSICRDEYKSTGTHWIVLYVNGDGVTNLKVSELIKLHKFIGNKNIKINIYRIQTNDSIMCA